uniref:Cap-specific mRNA (nucleoside-2'-O-)-methyltransferase n=1 Tax=Palpitomonas bilix TaxID=652834 RepID=A0A7S3D3R6_9EUKA|mmetsp:Transcript_20845/g.53807  ORF Transcript_20845/g.53807 Transcript_20845/m.53807 type:complete len:757 (+) Transcript_20845:190-2460(+)
MGKKRGKSTHRRRQGPYDRHCHAGRNGDHPRSTHSGATHQSKAGGESGDLRQHLRNRARWHSDDEQSSLSASGEDAVRLAISKALETKKPLPVHIANKIIDSYGHLEQARGSALRVKSEGELKRVLHLDAPRMKYRRRRGEVKSVVHWGQRKLMLSEIEFLTLHASPGITCVYAGAAPGTHLGLLSDMFPEVNFVLIDPSDFSVKPTPRICIRQEFMTHKVAEEFAGKDILFVSDIRSADFKILSETEVEEAVSRDMTWQKEWHLIMKPKAAMYKFRLPWVEGSTEYLEGDVYLPVWGPQTTTETRLIVTSCNLRSWDHKLYEEQMFFFNNVARTEYFEHDVESDGLCHCYDCTAEVVVLRQYVVAFLEPCLKVIGQRCREEVEASADEHRQRETLLVEKMIDVITVGCGGGGRSGRSLGSWKKRKGFDTKLFDVENFKLVKVEDSETAALKRKIHSTAQDFLQTVLAQATPLMWSCIGEPVMEDIEWDGGRRGELGIGTDVPPGCIVDIWLWNYLEELLGDHDKALNVENGDHARCSSQDKEGGKVKDKEVQLQQDQVEKGGEMGSMMSVDVEEEGRIEVCTNGNTASPSISEKGLDAVVDPTADVGCFVWSRRRKRRFIEKIFPAVLDDAVDDCDSKRILVVVFKSSSAYAVSCRKGELYASKISLFCEPRLTQTVFCAHWKMGEDDEGSVVRQFHVVKVLAIGGVPAYKEQREVGCEDCVSPEDKVVEELLMGGAVQQHVLEMLGIHKVMKGE